jgi:hypothetical protein
MKPKTKQKTKQRPKSAGLLTTLEAGDIGARIADASVFLYDVNARIADALELIALQGEIKMYKASRQTGAHPVAEEAGARMLILVERIAGRSE